MTGFQAALIWHGNAKVTAPKAQSAYYTQAILDELNEAIELLRKLKAAQTPEAYRKHTKEADVLLERHTGAPY